MDVISWILVHTLRRIWATAAVIIIEPECGRCDRGTNRERFVHHVMAPMTTPGSRFLILAVSSVFTVKSALVLLRHLACAGDDDTMATLPDRCKDWF